MAAFSMMRLLPLFLKRIYDDKDVQKEWIIRSSELTGPLCGQVS